MFKKSLVIASLLLVTNILANNTFVGIDLGKTATTNWNGNLSRI
jgi:hypothetical protein